MRAEDLDEDITLTIKSVRLEKMQSFDGADTEKPVMAFSDYPKSMVVNKTNWATIEKALGSDDSDDWIGRKITLFVQDVEARGEIVHAIRIRLPAKPRRGPAPKAAAAASANPSSAEAVQQFWRMARGFGLSKEQGLKLLEDHGGDFGAATAFLEADNALPE